jgi:hypothetical protein
MEKNEKIFALIKKWVLCLVVVIAALERSITILWWLCSLKCTAVCAELLLCPTVNAGFVDGIYHIVTDVDETKFAV